jgi:hypothetical protein
MQKLFNSIQEDNPSINFEPGDRFFWNPHSSTVFFVEDEIHELNGIWSLLHELGHAKLNHKSYRDDLQLLMMEVGAWSEAKNIAGKYNVAIEERHIEKCIDSYRVWLHQRSRCIDCKTNSLQLNKTTYKCHNCGTSWTVPETAVCQIRKRRVIKNTR